MPDYVLKIAGPRSMARYVSAGDEAAAIVMAKASVLADYVGESDPEVLAAALSLTSEDGTDYWSTVGTMLTMRPDRA